MEKFGFVYIWRNRRLNRYYIGSHWGTEDDGYICSNDAMREAHRRKPKAFRRRIVKKVHSREDLLIEEQRWLDMIKPEEYGKKFYNISSSANGSWAGAWNPKFREKWMESHWSRNGKTQDVVDKINTPKRNKKIQKSVQALYDNGYVNPNKGKPRPPEATEKCRVSNSKIDWMAISPSGKQYTFRNLKNFCCEQGLEYKNLHCAIQYKGSYKCWEVTKII